MKIEVDSVTERRINEQLSAGNYNSPEQVVEDAVRKLGEESKQTTESSSQFRQGGYWHGRISIADDFDELPPDLQEAFGLTDR